MPHWNPRRCTANALVWAVVAIASLAMFQGCSNSGASGLNGELSGTGATFPSPLYQRWFHTYHTEVNRGVRVSYSSQGSSKGVNAVIQGTHDFGASDAAMKDSEIGQVTKGDGILMLPMTAGAVVVAYNAPMDGLRLDRATLADIFLGKITRWNDPAILATNQALSLPDSEINVIVRSDGSGTTFAFTNHLQSIHPEWRAKFGVSKSVNWLDRFIQKKGNEGIAAEIAQTPNSIGYVEFSFARGELKTAALQNKAGMFVAPSIESFQNGLTAGELPENMRLFLPDPEGEGAFPIVTYSWILVYRHYADEDKARMLKSVLDWCLTEGQSMSEQLGYVPLPTEIVDQVRERVKTIR